MTKLEYNHAVNKLDWRAAEMLEVIHRLDKDRVSTTDIREETGFDNTKVRYRREKLVDLGLIETTQSTRNGVPMTYYSVSEQGKTAIRRGLLREHDMGEPGDFDELVARIEAVESRFNEIQADIRDVRGRVDEVADNIESRLGGATSVDEDLQALRDDVDKLQEKAKRDQKGGLFG